MKAMVCLFAASACVSLGSLVYHTGYVVGHSAANGSEAEISASGYRHLAEVYARRSDSERSALRDALQDGVITNRERDELEKSLARVALLGLVEKGVSDGH